MRVPLDRLPRDAVERHGVLRTYFCDKDATATAEADAWHLALAWPGGIDRHIDPNLSQGLLWWGGGVEPATMALQSRREGRVLTALYDTWTLLSWSEWLERSTHHTESPLVVLHVDDHRDLGAPRIYQSTGGIWTDAITGLALEMNDASSVRRAIESGAIGMGSFLTPWLHHFTCIDVRHLCQPPKATRTDDFSVVPTTEADSLLQPGAERLAIRLEPAEIRGTRSYRIATDAVEWVHDLGAGPILVHIDMDYFNNRYDGDSDWHRRSPAFDPPQEAIDAKIDELATALSAPSIAARIQDIVVAYSPGFFPAEFWQRANDQLKRRLTSFYDR